MCFSFFDCFIVIASALVCGANRPVVDMLRRYNVAMDAIVDDGVS